MEILIVTPAVAPYSSQSELSAFAASLAKGLRCIDQHAVVASPLYDGVDPATHSLARRLSTLPIVLDGVPDKCTLYDGRTTGGVDMMFIGHAAFGAGPASDDSLEARKQAAVLGQAAIALAGQLDAPPDVIHAVGFQAALALPLAKALPNGPTTVLTPANLKLQGRMQADELDAIEPTGPLSALLSEPKGNYLAAGIAAADRLILSSQAESDTLLADTDLHLALGERRSALSHVLPGLDAAIWNPLTDSHLTARFDPADAGGKRQCKGALQHEGGLGAQPSTPLIAVLGGALDGDDHAALEALLRNNVQVLVGLDSPASPGLEALCKSHEGKLAALEFDGDDAVHRIVSGADFLWLPRTRPLGDLLHLCGLRYGALPVVLRDGGPAAEVIIDCDGKLTTGNGFVYDDADGQLSALQRAIAAFAKEEVFEGLRSRAMRTDMSWERAARHFMHAYKSAQ